MNKEKKNIENLSGILIAIISCWLFFSLSSCRKDQGPDEIKSSDKVFSGTYSNIYDKWKLIAIENGFNNSGKAADFDYLEFIKTGLYEIVKNEIIIEKGNVSKDTANSTDNLLHGTFIADGQFSLQYIQPADRYFILKNDTLIILPTLDTEYSYRFVRFSKWLTKSDEGFHMNTGNLVVLEQNEIEYYDFSAHLIYLKDKHSLIKRLNGGLIDVYSDKDLIYPAVLYPQITNSYFPKGANIMSWPSLYPDNVVFINYSRYPGFTDNRDDERIVYAFKKYSQYHEGLGCSIDSVRVTTDNKVILGLTLSNNDTFDYYYLDPAKMGLKLFHYFTEGLKLTDDQDNNYVQRTGFIQPEPWDSWKKEWLSLIKSGENISISILYDQFDSIPPGKYQAFFQFPGLTYQVKNDEIQQAEGRIWLGKLNLTKEITRYIKGK